MASSPASTRRLAALKRALRQRPAYAEAHYNRGKVLEKIGDARGACEAFRRAAAIDPRHPHAGYLHARALLLLGEPEAALLALEGALADNPRDDWCSLLKGQVLWVRDGVGAALAWCREVAPRLPASGMMQRYLATMLLAAGELEEGWRAYLRRDLAGPAPRAEVPAALPGRLDGTTLLLRAEQGLGDVLFFLRFALLLADRGARLQARVPAKLVPLLARTGRFAAVHDERAPAAALGPFTASLDMGDLPVVAGHFQAAPPTPLAPLEARGHAWRERLAAAGPGPYLGVTWRAGTDFRRGPEFGRNIQLLSKEIDLPMFGQALAGIGATLVVLQRAPAAGEVATLAKLARCSVFDASAANDDLEEALALLDALDDCVGVSNTNMHLCAGLGRTARVLVPFPPDWRWMAEGNESLWFPGFRLYRQTPGRDWSKALARLAADLRVCGTGSSRR